MDPDRWRQIEQLYDDALRRPEDERATFLINACGKDEMLRREVESLLAQERSAETFLQGPALEMAAGLIDDPGVSLIGQQLGGYQVLSLLGVGGMGEVYRARDKRLGRDVAIKVLPKAFASDPDRLSRFEREARLLATLNHPNIAAIYGFEESAGQPALVLELVEGPTLAEVLAQGSGLKAQGLALRDRGPGPKPSALSPKPGPSGLALDEVLSVARQIAEALEAAHAKGIVHRDLKPANIKLKGAWGTFSQRLVGTPPPRVGPTRGKTSSTARGDPTPARFGPQALASSVDSQPRLTGDVVVKILDFGLAKVWAPDSAGPDLSHAPTMTSTGTREGVLLGTAAYMSPEQARGRALDKRTDIWAFGCVLFEMLTGRPTFKGETLSDTLARILEREPEWQKLPRSTPARVRDLLRRCLQKDPEKRLADLADARRDIEACLASPFKIPLAIFESLSWSVSHPTVRWSLAVMAVVVTGLTIYQLRDGEAPIPQLTNPLQVTRAIGVEDYPTWSPDGGTLAYESNETGNWDIWLAQVGGGSSVNRTVDHAGSDRYPSWSPDGRQIAFWSAREGGGFYLMPALGGVPQRIASTEGINEISQSPPAWLADGTQIALAIYKVVGNRFEAYAQIISLATRDARDIRLPGIEESRIDLSWSRDGRYLAYVDSASQLGEVTRLKVLRLSDGAALDVTGGRTNVRSPHWSPDGRYLFFVSNQIGVTDWWRQRIAGDGSAMGEPQRVTTALEVPNGAFSTDGKKLAYSKGRWVSNVWRVPILTDRPATWADAQQMTFDQAFIEFVNVSPDGRHLAFSSDRAGNQDLWRMPIGGSEPTQLTADPAPDWAPGWSPDGTRLAFYSFRSGDREIWVMPAAGGPANQLTRTEGLDAGHAWSPDGQTIAFRSERTGDSEIWTISADGKTERQLTMNPAGDYSATWSPDGKWLAFFSNRTGKMQIWRMPATGGTPDLLSRGSGTSPRWAPDGDHIYFVGQEEQAGKLWELSLKDRTERAVTNLTGKRGTLGYQGIATDGTYIYFPWRDDLGDIWVMDVSQQ